MAGTNKKTKKEIEADYPTIQSPGDCPKAIIDWVVKKDDERDYREMERDKALVKLIEETIDKLFDKHFRKYVTMIYSNRIFVVILAAFLVALWILVLHHFKATALL